jgi:Carboxypeptidase regulatory-like domain
MRSLAIAITCLVFAILSRAECVTVTGVDPTLPTFHASSRRIRITALQEGKPLANVQIIFYLKADDLHPKLALMTDSFGSALATDLAPGQYRILAIGPEKEFTAVYLEVPNQGRSRTNSFLLGIPPTFLPQKAEDIEAAPITEHIREFKGYVADPSGSFVPGALVQIYRKESQSDPVAVAKIKADNSGSFGVPLSAGKYVVFVSSPGFVTKIVGFEIEQEGEPKDLRIEMRIGSC